MEPINLGYSTKNIPVAQPREYLKCLVSKTESFLRRIRWKAYHFLKPAECTSQVSASQESFGFRSTKSPPPMKELEEFENRMFSIIQNVKFNKRENDFQKTMMKDLKNIRNEDKVLVSADKTTNFYKLDAPSYDKLLNNTITKSYKKTNANITSTIARQEKIVAENLGLADRIDALAPKNCFVTLKDHKPNFQNNPTCRLINPSKSEIGVISKQLLQRINSNILANTNLNQWKNTSSVISWFKNLPNKSSRSFICFDIVDFYPSITEELLLNALTFASQFNTITDEEKHIIIQAKKSVLFNRNQVWRKKQSDSLFDVTMGSFDGAETCDLVGLFLLSKLPPEYRSEIGLYRDDGLAAFDKKPREIENIKKQICSVFNKNNLKITIEANKKCVNYLDVTFDLRLSSYKPYMKPGNTLQYVHRQSNHPPAVLKAIPEAINNRLSSISSDEQAFNSACPLYQDALHKSGYNYNLNYNPPKPKTKRTRNRNIIWFNPPYNSNVRTNIGHKFLQAIGDCFPKNHPLNKIFNRNTLKLSYSCMPNIHNIISGHNKSVISKFTSTDDPSTNPRPCNCRNKSLCPLHGKCLTANVVYQATVVRNDTNQKESYVGHTERKFKTRYNCHTSSFRLSKYKNATELSKYIWKLKESKVNYSVNWRIIKQCKSYNNTTKRCSLCTHEKFIIIYHPELCSLNSRSELLSKCRHRNKFLLSNIT